MDERTSRILNALVRRYIKTAQPVASSHLVEDDFFSLSSATIRSTLNELQKEGYLDQPHTSSGRTPTDKGYRHYVNQIKSNLVNKRRLLTLSKKIESMSGEHSPLARAAAMFLSNYTHAPAMVAWMSTGEIHEAGINELLSNITKNDFEAIYETAVVLSGLENYLKSLAELTTNQVAIFIGCENPYLNTTHTSILARTLTSEDNDQYVMAIVGPKRMSYDRNIEILEIMSQILNNP